MSGHDTRRYDGTRVWLITIIAADLVGAVRCSPSRCILANAIGRRRGVLDKRVGADIVSILTRRGWMRLQLDDSTKAAIRAYDEANQPLPIGFVARLTPPRQPLGSRSGERPGSNKRSGKRLSVATRRPSSRHINVEPVS